MPRRNRRESVRIEPNLTSLIDVTFLLIVFFVLVSRLNEIQNVEMDLPSPLDPATAATESEHQLFISVLPALDGSTAGYRVGVHDFPADASGIDAMTAHLNGLYQLNANLDVNVRADRATHFEHVEPVIQAIATAARASGAMEGSAPVARVNLAVTRERGR